jgi:hypothetical protein
MNAKIGPYAAMTITAKIARTDNARKMFRKVFTLNSKLAMQQSGKAQRQLRFPTTTRRS